MRWNTRRAQFAALAPPIDTEGPRVRLGLAWFGVLALLTAAGPAAMGCGMAVTGAVAANQAARSRKDQHEQAVVGMCTLGGAAVPAMAVAGPLGAIVAMLVIALGSFAWEPVRALLGRYDESSRTRALRTASIATLVGLGAAAPVLARDLGLAQGLTFVTLISVYDASAYIVGSGATSPWEGHAAGAASIAAASLAVAAVLVPPFTGASPWILGAVLIVSAPAGAYLATALLGDRGANVPVLRRVDSFIVAGPLWVVVASALAR